jgi:hypothetical protein
MRESFEELGQMRPSDSPTHSLRELLQAVDDVLRAGAHAPLSPGVVEIVRELDRFDPRADAFRFHARAPRGKAQKSGTKPKDVTNASSEAHFVDEVWVDVCHLRAIVREVDVVLMRLARDLRSESSP